MTLGDRLVVKYMIMGMSNTNISVLIHLGVGALLATEQKIPPVKMNDFRGQVSCKPCGDGDEHSGLFLLYLMLSEMQHKYFCTEII